MQETPVTELPTRDEALSVLKYADSLVAYDEKGRRVGLDSLGVRRCRVCDAPSGEVQLQRVYPKGSANDKAHGEPFICVGGNCSRQQTVALMRPFKRAARQMGTRRLTASGKALQWVLGADGTVTQEYALTSREHTRRKAARKQQDASRRANRGR